MKLQLYKRNKNSCRALFRFGTIFAINSYAQEIRFGISCADLVLFKFDSFGIIVPTFQNGNDTQTHQRPDATDTAIDSFGGGFGRAERQEGGKAAEGARQADHSSFSSLVFFWRRSLVPKPKSR